MPEPLVLPASLSVVPASLSVVPASLSVVPASLSVVPAEAGTQGRRDPLMPFPPPSSPSRSSVIPVTTGIQGGGDAGTGIQRRSTSSPTPIVVPASLSVVPA